MKRFVLTAIIMMVTITPLWASDPPHHVLKNRIVRALAVEAGDVDHIIVGQKANKPGSAFVFQSLDGGKTWRFLNGNKPLTPEASDVQAVLPLSKQTILAGTWKHGLYVSRAGGTHSFERVANFPSNDIRDLKQANNGTVYAATARHGVFQSTDDGQTWNAIGPNRDFFWSLTLTGNAVYASSPETGIWEYKNGKWHHAFRRKEAQAYAAAESGKPLNVVATKQGLFGLRGTTWRKLQDGEFSDVYATPGRKVIASTWNDGLYIFKEAAGLRHHILAGESVVHVAVAGGSLLVGTWGNGLFTVPLANPQNNLGLIAATKRNDLAGIQAMLKSGTAVDAHDKNRNTALIFAARDGFTEIAQALISAGANPNWIDGEGVTPLILAADRNHIDIVKLLVALKADESVKDVRGNRAIDYARKRGTDDLVFKLLERN